MTTMTADSVFNGLTSLTPQQLREVQARASALLGAGSGSDVEANQDELLLLESMTMTLRELGMVKAMPYAALTRMPFYKQFHELAPAVLNYVRTYLKPRDRAAMTSMLRFTCSLLADHLKRQERAVNYRTLTYVLADLHAVIEFNFPGYLDAGLLPTIAQRLASGR